MLREHKQNKTRKESVTAVPDTDGLYFQQCMAMHCYALAVFISDAWLPSNDE